MSKIDVARIVKEINQHLIAHHFKPRDADGSDFMYGEDQNLRFKTGTVYGEVTVSVWKNGRQLKQPIRILNEYQIAEAKHEIDAIISDYRSPEHIAVEA